MQGQQYIKNNKVRFSECVAAMVKVRTAYKLLIDRPEKVILIIRQNIA